MRARMAAHGSVHGAHAAAQAVGVRLSAYQFPNGLSLCLSVSQGRDRLHLPCLLLHAGQASLQGGFVSCMQCPCNAHATPMQRPCSFHAASSSFHACLARCLFPHLKDGSQETFACTPPVTTSSGPGLRRAAQRVGRRRAEGGGAHGNQVGGRQLQALQHLCRRPYNPNKCQSLVRTPTTAGRRARGALALILQ